MPTAPIRSELRMSNGRRYTIDHGLGIITAHAVSDAEEDVPMRLAKEPTVIVGEPLKFFTQWGPDGQDVERGSLVAGSGVTVATIDTKYS